MATLRTPREIPHGVRLFLRDGYPISKQTDSKKRAVKIVPLGAV